MFPGFTDLLPTAEIYPVNLCIDVLTQTVQ